MLIELIDKTSEFISTKLEIVIILLFIGILIFPFIDNNFLYFQRMNNRVDLLEQINLLNYDELKGNEILEKEYNSIVNEIDDYNKNYVFSYENIFNERIPKNVKSLKIITGILVPIIITLFVIIQRKKKIKEILVSKFIINILVWGFLMGFLAMTLPTFRDHKFNYFGVPILQSLFLYSMYMKNKPEKLINEN